MSDYIDGGMTFSAIVYVPIPTNAPVGPARVYCCAYTYIPAGLGSPYCPEVSANFSIASGTSMTGMESIEFSSSGTFRFSFEIPEEARSGTYTVYACTRYGREMSFSYTSFTVTRLPRIKISPRYNIMRLNESLQLDIMIADVINLTSWEIEIYYNSTVLNATEIVEGTFLSNTGTTTFEIYDFTDNYNSTHGRIWLNCSLTSRDIGASGNGTLTKITFKAKTSEGYSWISLKGTKLIDNQRPPNYIQHTSVNGFIIMGIHEIAVIEVIPHKTIVGVGSLLPIYVTVSNNGHYVESFNISVYANTTVVQVGNFTLQPSQSSVITLNWDTTGFTAYTHHVISVHIPPVPEERNTENNSFSDGTIILVIQGDINADKIVDIFDAVKLASAAGSQPGYLNWNANCDLNCDNIIDIFDAVILAANAGKSAI